MWCITDVVYYCFFSRRHFSFGTFLLWIVRGFNIIFVLDRVSNCRYRWHHLRGADIHIHCGDICQTSDNDIQFVKTPLLPRLCPVLWCDFVNLLMQNRKLIILNRFITWAGEGTGLFQFDLLVSVDGQLQAAAQLLVHQAAFAIAGAVRHEAGQVSVAHAVSTHHTLTGQGHHRRSYFSETGELRESAATWWRMIYSYGWRFFNW